jgi:hypothetical protein
MPDIRTYLQAKNGALGPHIVGPTDFVQWATANKGDYQRGETSLEQLSTMLGNLFDTGGWASKAISVRFTVGAPYIGAVADLARGIANDTLVNAAAANAVVTPNEYQKTRLKKVTKMMCAFSMNMENWAYPACEHYYTVKRNEAEDGVTADFMTKHVSSTQDDRSTKRVAQIRGAPVAARSGIGAFGNIVTQRSGGLLQEELGDFCKEIKSRQKEFTDTYAGLTQFYTDNCEFLGNGGAANFAVLIDHVTFITLRKYKMYEYVDARGGEDNVYIHFGVSATADGKSWAVHHLARTTSGRAIANGTAVTGLGCPAADATTSVHDPY